LYVHVPDITME